MMRWIWALLASLLLVGDARAADAVVVLDATQRERIALATAPLVAGRDSGEVAATGRVLDPTPLFDVALARATAQSIAERTSREVARVRRLSRGQENASARDLEIAEDDDRRAHLELETAHARFVAAWGNDLAQGPALGALLAPLVTRHAALARVDVPTGNDALGAVTGMRLAVALRPERPLAARILGPAPSVDPVVQGFGWLVLIEAEPPPTGTALVATLVFAERAFEGVVVPRSAVVRREGGAFVYVEASPGSFERRAASLLRPREDGWLATGALAPGDRVVVRGAQELLAAEFARAEPAEAD
jgi:hypothetical protein